MFLLSYLSFCLPVWRVFSDAKIWDRQVQVSGKTSIKILFVFPSFVDLTITSLHEKEILAVASNDWWRLSGA